jgi:hypothetical protein
MGHTSAVFRQSKEKGGSASMQFLFLKTTSRHQQADSSTLPRNSIYSASIVGVFVRVELRRSCRCPTNTKLILPEFSLCLSRKWRNEKRIVVTLSFPPASGYSCRVASFPPLASCQRPVSHWRLLSANFPCLRWHQYRPIANVPPSDPW